MFDATLMSNAPRGGEVSGVAADPARQRVGRIRWAAVQVHESDTVHVFFRAQRTMPMDPNAAPSSRAAFSAMTSPEGLSVVGEDMSNTGLSLLCVRGW
ncbi:hypothetical protein ACFWNE_17305 [Streptomyces goshikiensis]|uniref:hypothetical protein n=1 Tax=Streptomyces goshikiensis TaxID=1942 RepID=UPI003665C09E